MVVELLYVYCPFINQFLPVVSGEVGYVVVASITASITAYITATITITSTIISTTI